MLASRGPAPAQIHLYYAVYRRPYRMADATTTELPLASVLPVTASISPAERLALGGCDAVELVRRFGSPLYVFDEETLRTQCRAFIQEFRQRLPETKVRYASKAYIGRALAALLKEEGLGLDVVSGGELAIALSVGFPAAEIDFHGNNKSEQELREAVSAGIGHVVVDNFHEVALLDRVAQELGRRQPVLLRLSPGVDPHTHGHTTTGILDSKFGFPIQTGAAAEAVGRALHAPGLELRGYHAHLGSPIFELEPFEQASDVMMSFAEQMVERHNFVPLEYSPGGGFAVQYLAAHPAPAIAEYAEVVNESLRRACERHHLPLPSISIEPGRSIVGRAGVALYTVGARKEIPDLRTYVSVDGGMADNIRPAIYGSEYEAIVANRPLAEAEETVTIAGKYCESGDLLIKDVRLPRLRAGDVIAIPASGAYCLSMASNYNAALKPAIVMVRNGQARLIRRRETYDDLMRTDVFHA
jgi:diaminopimelate decarboxylase